MHLDLEALLSESNIRCFAADILCLRFCLVGSEASSEDEWMGRVVRLRLRELVRGVLEPESEGAFGWSEEESAAEVSSSTSLVMGDSSFLKGNQG